jgi:hypothetical protein
LASSPREPDPILFQKLHPVFIHNIYRSTASWTGVGGRCGGGPIVAHTTTAIVSAARMVAPKGFARSMWRLSVTEFEPPHLGQARQAIFAVEKVDDIPHGRTPLFGEGIEPSVCFRMSSRADKMAS